MPFLWLGTLYPDSNAAHDAIARTYLSAHGKNTRNAMLRAMAAMDPDEMADDAIEGYSLLAEDDEGNRVMPDFSRGALIDAFRRLKRDFDQIYPPEVA